MVKKKDNIEIVYGDVFYSDSVTITFNRAKFILDFKQSVPRITKIGEKEKRTIVVKHNTIMIDPPFAKVLADTFINVIKNYENKFGKLNVKKRRKKEESSYIG